MRKFQDHFFHRTPPVDVFETFYLHVQQNKGNLKYWLNLILFLKKYSCWTSIIDYLKLRMQSWTIFLTTIVKMCSISCHLLKRNKKYFKLISGGFYSPFVFSFSPLCFCLITFPLSLCFFSYSFSSFRLIAYMFNCYSFLSKCVFERFRKNSVKLWILKLPIPLKWI